LDENIQMETHDSIEDARCALMLYKAYREFEEQGILDKQLEELYKQGKQFVRGPSRPLCMLIDC
jgi:PAB-dependent poly(A)-specific ribonuclease subunit 2